MFLFFSFCSSIKGGSPGTFVPPQRLAGGPLALASPSNLWPPWQGHASASSNGSGSQSAPLIRRSCLGAVAKEQNRLPSCCVQTNTLEPAGGHLPLFGRGQIYGFSPKESRRKFPSYGRPSGKSHHLLRCAHCGRGCAEESFKAAQREGLLPTRRSDSA